MNAESQPLNFICDIKIFEIPFFQRGYVWGTENWEELFEEMQNFNSSHFLGSVILKKVDDDNASKPSKSIIIDGQQRLTTLSILLKAFYDTFSEDIKNNLIDTVLKYLFYKEKETSSEYKIKLKHSRYDNEDYQKVIGMVLQNGKEKTITQLTADEIKRIDDDSENDKTHKVLKCYKYFYQKLVSMDEEIRTDIFENLISDNNDILVVIHLGKSDKEQKIFDTINSSGVRLSATDIVKNALFDALLQTAEKREDVIKTYDSLWAGTFSKDEPAIGYWGTKKAQGRLYRDNSEILLSSFALIKGIYDPYDAKQNIEDIPDLMKKYIGKIIKENEKSVAYKMLNDFLQEIVDYAEIYRSKIIIFDKNYMYYYNDPQIKVLKTLEMMEVTSLTPYLLYLYKKYEKDTKKLNTKFNDLFKLLMIKLINHESSSNYNKASKFMINDQKYVTDRLVEYKNKNWYDGISLMKKNKDARIILFWLELNRRFSDKKIPEKGLHDQYTLEHVMPVTWETNWLKVPVIDVNNDKVIDNSEEAKQYRKGMILSLGNMTLLSQEVNSAVGNKAFEDKKNDYKQYGYTITITNNDIIVQYMDKKKQWDERAIIKRENELKEELKKMFE
jgi:uncharacterized protein with ParB-like and HNH nuclease domain